MTLKELIDQFLRTLTVEVSTGQKQPATFQWYKHQLQLLDTIGATHCDEFNAASLAGLKLGYHLVRAVRRLSRWGFEQGHMAADRFAKLKVPRCGQRTRTLTPEEFTRLLGVSIKPFRAYLHLLAETGARPGELRQLKWDQVKLDTRQIILTKFKAKEWRGDGASVRVIPLTKRAVVLLRWLLRRGSSGYVLTNSRGKPWSKNAVRCQMMRARIRAGLESGDGERVVCYSLRHTRATHLIRNGVDVSTVATILGHTGIDMTRRYVHLSTGDICKVLDQVGK